MNDDLFRRICRKQCVPEPSDEIEIFDAESTELSIEEEAVQEEAEEPFDLKAWAKELECMKRRIQLLQLRLKQKSDVCPEEPCVDLEVELTCSENKEICALQKNHSKLQYQINELIRCCCFAKQQIKDLRTRMCEKSKDIAQLQRMVAVLESWRKTLEHEFGICLERFEYLKHVKAEWKDVLEKIEKRKHCWQKMEQLYVHKSCYNQDKAGFIKESDELREIFKHLCILQMERHTEICERMSALEQRLEKAEAEAAAKPTQLNMPEAVPKTIPGFDLDELVATREVYESTQFVHKVFLGQAEVYPKGCR